MAATQATLPAVGCVQLTRKRGENVTGEDTDPSRSGATRNEEVAAFLASVRLGSLQRAPRPGDFFRPSRHASSGGQRPLGLIPNRGHVQGTFLPRLFPVYGVLAAQQREESDDRDVRRRYDGESTFRFTERDAYPRRAPSRTAVEVDGEYADTLAKCKMQDYITSSEVYVPQKNDANAPSANRHRRSKTVPETGTKLLQYSHSNIGAAEYFSFINQANLTRKMLYSDQRHAPECRECERCRGRRGRCPHCLAIRVGGGYIILDGGEIPEHRRRYGGKDRYQWTGGMRSEMDGHPRNKKGFGLGALSDSANLTGSGGGGGVGEGGDGGDGGGRGGWEGGRGGEGGMGLGGWSGEGDDKGFGDGSGKGVKGGSNYGGGLGDDEDWRDGQDGSAISGSGLWDGSGMESGRQSNFGQRPGSRLTGSRPGSRFGTRPPSSIRRLGGRGGDRKKGVNFERESGGDGRGREGEGEGGEDEDENDKRNRRRRRRGREGEDEEDDGKSGRYKYGYGQEGDDLEAAKSGSLGDLMRFKSKKRDDVKVLKATLKELKDIDPLDYLARYCIIDQQKVPHYRRVYDNVDRDEDDEIDILELDFALKAVNFDLISDCELSYVNSVLEIAGRHKLNFRFFCLIAALSEKVVALDNMVKRLINKMDFEALEVKLKKCKELFYLLADSERVEQGGVVTVSSLAVELQAGGLTQEHVEYVCDHMNHEDRGLVEFLDYLTYVPLFVEIHDNISDNPLDFTRTK